MKKNGFIRVKELMELLQLSRSTIWRMTKNGILPPKVKISQRTVGWYRADIDDFIAGKRQNHAVDASSYGEIEEVM